MKQAHFTLQGKGGVGKSLLSSLVVQYLMSNTRPVVPIDIDPINATLAGYKALKARRLEVVGSDHKIDPERFDEMIMQIIDEDSNFVIDNGASSFVALTSYIIENDIINMIQQSGKQVYIHTIIKGDQDLVPTLSGFNAVANHMPASARIVVWLNAHAGQITSDGKHFEEMKAYKKNKERVHGIVRLEHEAGTMHGDAMKKMLGSWLTFEEALSSPDFNQMIRSRLFRVRDSIFKQLDEVIK